jgi:hypothetical protein
MWRRDLVVVYTSVCAGNDCSTVSLPIAKQGMELGRGWIKFNAISRSKGDFMYLRGMLDAAITLYDRARRYANECHGDGDEDFENLR